MNSLHGSLMSHAVSLGASNDNRDQKELDGIEAWDQKILSDIQQSLILGEAISEESILTKGYATPEDVLKLQRITNSKQKYL